MASGGSLLFCVWVGVCVWAGLSLKFFIQSLGRNAYQNWPMEITIRRQEKLIHLTQEYKDDPKA